MPTTPAAAPDPREIRARLAWSGVRVYEIAPLVGRHPALLSRLLSGKRPLTPELAQRIVDAIETLARTPRPRA